MAEQTSFTVPIAQVQPPVMTVARKLVGAPPVEVITSMQLQQQIQVGNPVGQVVTQGFSTFNFIWQPVPGQETNDLAAALADAGWDVDLPTLDPTFSYQIALTRVQP